MRFLKINRFAWILAISLALLFPKIAFWDYWDVFLSQESSICKINENSCIHLINNESIAWIAPVDDDEFYFIWQWNIIKHYNITTWITTDFWDAFINTRKIAYRNWKLATLSDTNIYITNIDSIEWNLVVNNSFELWSLSFNSDWSWLFYHNSSDWLMYVEIWQSPEFFKSSSSYSDISVSTSWNVYYYTQSYLYRVNENWWESEQLTPVFLQNFLSFDISQDENYIYWNYFNGSQYIIYKMSFINWDRIDLYASYNYAWWTSVFKQFTQPPQPPKPSEIVLNWLSCNSNNYPDLDNVTWYNDFMNNSWFLISVDDDWWTRFYSYSGSYIPESRYINRAWLYYADQTQWGSFFSGSLNFPWTQRTNIRWWNKSSLLLSFSDSEIKPNILQFHEVDNIALGYAWTIEIQNTKLEQFPEVPLSSSGWIATAVIVNNQRINKALLNYSSGFNWFRYWIAPLVNKTACSYKYNICEWSIEWNKNICKSWNLVWWIPAWNCVIAGSWSLYWSGSCIPETTASGSIIPPFVPWVTVFDSEWNPVWNIYENNKIEKLSCGYTSEDDFFDTIKKSVKCIFNYVSNAINTWSSWIDTLQGTSQALWESVNINPITNTWTATWSIWNPLLSQLKEVDKWASEQKYVKMTFWIFVFFFTILMVAIIATVIKWGIKNNLNN